MQSSNLTKHFEQGSKNVDVLRGVSLSLDRGDFTAVMGPSGSGKSTLLHILAGLLTPDTGTVEIAGMRISEMGDGEATRFRRRHIGLVFQDFNLIPTLTVAENIRLPEILDGRMSDSKRTDEILDRLQISHRRDHSPHELSGGERQRVAIGRALIMNPEVIFADEPTGNLDSLSSRRFCELLTELNREGGCTILLVTHNPAVAAWSRRVHFLKDGRICDTLDVQAGGDPSRIAERYLHVIDRLEN